MKAITGILRIFIAVIAWLIFAAGIVLTGLGVYDFVMVFVHLAEGGGHTTALTPSIIMCGWNVWSTHFQYLKAEEFKFDWNDNQGYTFSDFGGTYKEIPVIRFRSDLLSNTVIVADFTAAFLLQQRISEDAFKEVLRVSISEISEADATALIAENPTIWKGDMSQEDAITRLRNSIKVDFYLIERFLIGNPETYRVIEIRT